MTKNPVYGFIAYLLVQIALGAGFISQEQAVGAQEQIEILIVYGVLAVSAFLGFREYILAHKHAVTKDAQVKMDNPIVDETVKTQNPAIPVFAEQDAGTPPPVGDSSTVQNPSSMTPPPPVSQNT